jgi:hypothetical protein
MLGMKKIHAIIIVLLLIASLSIAGCSSSNDDHGVKASAEKKAAYNTFMADLRNESAALVKNNPDDFRTVNLEYKPFSGGENWTFSGYYVMFYEGPLTEGWGGPYLKEVPKDNNYTNLNLTVFYVVKTKLDKTQTYELWGVKEVGYWAHYDIYAIKYPEMTPLVKSSNDVSPPYEKPKGYEPIGNEHFVWTDLIRDHQLGNKSVLLTDSTLGLGLGSMY